MVDWTNIPDRNRGQQRPRYSANVAPIRLGQDDARSELLRNTAIQRANEVRERRATLENEDWLMSRPAHWYKELDDQGEPSNWRAAKNVLKHIPAVTTDINENRNMFQMLANQMLGGNRGARLIDTRGLPGKAYRTGSRIYQDPSKSQGVFGDMRTWAGDILPGVSQSPNPAAIHVNEWNPFPNFGQEGRDWYVDQFGEPWGEKLEGLMKLALPGPLKWMKENKKEPLPSDRSWVPENVGSYKKIPEIPFMGDFEDETFGTAPVDDVTISDLPYDWVDDITETDTFSNLPHHSKRSMYPRDNNNRKIIPGYGTTYIDEYPLLGIDEKFFDDEPVEPPQLPTYDDSEREAGIMTAMRAPYTRENYSLPFPPRGPHDPFDPDQEMFENREEYDAWLRRQRLGY